jgi:hypothetical protein
MNPFATSDGERTELDYPGTTGVHGVAPLVLDDVEVRVADTTEEHLDGHVAFSLHPEITTPSPSGHKSKSLVH